MIAVKFTTDRYEPPPRPPLTAEELRVLNEALFERLGSRDPELNREAVDAVNAYTRARMAPYSRART